MKQSLWILWMVLSHLGAAKAASTLSLESYLKAVETESPEVQIEKSLHDESAARSQGIRLNPPMIGIMEMQDGGGRNQGIEISQEIPLPSKISKEKEMRQAEAEEQRSSSLYRRNEILLNARTAYFEFWQAFEKLEIIKEKRDWLKSHSKIARSTTRSDSAAQVHYLGIESEVDLLENEVLEAESTLIEKRNALKVFAPDLSITDAQPSEPALEKISVDNKNKSVLLSWKENELKSAQASQNLKQQSSLPDLFVRYRGYQGNEMTARSQEVMVGITLPFLFFWQPQAEKAEASAKSQRAQAELRKTQVELESRMSGLKQKTEALQKQILTLNEKLIPRAHKRMRLVENLSQRTMEGLDEHRTVMNDYLDLKLKALEARTEYEKSISEILKLAREEVLP